MATGWMSLAYLAEISVVFNLAFGEFKSKPFADTIQDLFEKIAQGHPEGFKFLDEATQIPNADARLAVAKKTELFEIAKILDKMRADQSAKSLPKGTFNAISWVKSKISREVVKSNNGVKKYSAFSGLIDRQKVFSIDPLTQEKSTFWGRLISCIPSWTYSKTEIWRHPFCLSSLVSWTIISGLLLIFGFSTEFFVSNFLSHPIFSSMRIHEWVVIPALVGFALAFFLPRPMTAFFSKLIGTYPPSPRSRYYSFVLTGVSTVMLCWLIWVDHASAQEVSDHLPPTQPERWYFIWGFFIGAILSPFLMLLGHYMLKSSLTKWYEWLNMKAKERGDEVADQLVKDGGE